MKSLSTKLLALTFIFALATGCASITDPGLADQPQPQIEKVTTPAPDQGFGIGNGPTMEPIEDRPILD